MLRTQMDSQIIDRDECIIVNQSVVSSVFSVVMDFLNYMFSVQPMYDFFQTKSWNITSFIPITLDMIPVAHNIFTLLDRWLAEDNCNY